jgi:hypothetical protein
MARPYLNVSRPEEAISGHQKIYRFFNVSEPENAISGHQKIFRFFNVLQAENANSGIKNFEWFSTFLTNGYFLNASQTKNATSIHQKSTYSNDGTTIFERFTA